jgi:ribose/xylose/arabinose/galactoside ABC-type transport system permease subunit
MTNLFKGVQLRQGILVILLVLLVGAVTAFAPNFLSLANLGNIAVQFSQIGLMAAGMTFVMIAGGIDLSVGSVLALGAGIGGILMSAEFPVPLAIVGALLGGMLIGWINGSGIAYLKIPALIITLGTLYAVRGAVELYSNGSGSTIAQDFPTAFRFLGQGSVLGIPMPTIVTLIVYVVLHLVLTKTRFGRYTIAVGTDAEAARRSGILVERHLTKIYILSGFMSVIAGLLITAQVNAASIDLGRGAELTVIAAVVVGGTSLYGGQGSIPGTFLGVTFLTIMADALDILNVSPFAIDLATGSLLLLSAAADVLANRKGLSMLRKRFFGTRETELAVRKGM